MNEEETIKKFQEAKIIIIGDVMIDHYLEGEVKRISQEAPVPIVNVKREFERLGGAANVAANIASLGGKAICISVTGKDEGRKRYEKLLEEKNIKGIIIEDEERKTTIKSRIISTNQQLLRLDYEDKKPISKETEEKIIQTIKELINEERIRVIIISDYAKGVITPTLLKKIIGLKEEGIKTIIDPKPETIKHCQESYLITPNHIEASRYAGIPEENGKEIIMIGEKIREELKSNVLITRGEKGMALFEKEKKAIIIPTQAKKVYDVTGAGDTVTAITALALATGNDLEKAVRLANKGAGIIVGKPGTETLTPQELIIGIE